jgi:hypothetical protein
MANPEPSVKNLGPADSCVCCPRAAIEGLDESCRVRSMSRSRRELGQRSRVRGLRKALWSSLSLWRAPVSEKAGAIHQWMKPAEASVIDRWLEVFTAGRNVSRSCASADACRAHR